MTLIFVGIPAVALNTMRQTSMKKLLERRCCSHKCPRYLQPEYVPAKQLSVCSGCKDTYYCDRQCQKDAWLVHKPLCQTPRDRRGQNSSLNDDDLDLPSSDQLSELALLKTFLDLHRYAFTNATVACVAVQGDSKTFDFRGSVMFFSLRHRHLDNNPGTAFSLVSAECLPINKLLDDFPDIKEALEETEAEYNSIAEFDQATKPNFAGLLKMVYWMDGMVVTKHSRIYRDRAYAVMDCEGWQSQLRFLIDNGLVGKAVDSDTVQTGKMVKRGSQWKWVPS